MLETKRSRPRVAVITRHWGNEHDETSTATRTIAGALACRADVDIVHLNSPPESPTSYPDSVFTIHRVPLHGARPLRASLVLAALSAHDGGRRTPSMARSVLEHYEGEAPDVKSVLETIRPDAVVLAGHQQPFDITALDGIRRVVFVPFLDDERHLTTASFVRLLDVADAIGVLHPGEERAVSSALGEEGRDRVFTLPLALSVNRSATANKLFGVKWYGQYILLIRNFPEGGPRFERSVTHEVLRNVVRHISVAEVDGEHWRISDDENTLELPVNPTRVNLWRLMAHALVTVDVRPPGPIGQEAIESMLLGTPVVVPEPSAAMEHAAAANGGLWYRDLGELFDSTRALMNRTLRTRLAEQGRDYAQRHHGQMDDFVRRVAELVLGETTKQSASLRN